MMVVILPPIRNLDRLLNMCSIFLDKTFTNIAPYFKAWFLATSCVDVLASEARLLGKAGGS
jgi:hypothetical protein